MDPRLRDILETSIGSVWGLELVLLLRRDASLRWQPDELVSELRSSRLVVDQSLSRLERGGLVVRDDAGAARFAPATPELSALIDLLEEEYRSRPGFVRRAIVSGPDSKLQSFTDAFLFRKPPK